MAVALMSETFKAPGSVSWNSEADISYPEVDIVVQEVDDSVLEESGSLVRVDRDGVGYSEYREGQEGQSSEEEEEKEEEEEEEDSDYDTDLDIELDRQRRKKEPERDDHAAYTQSCLDLGLFKQKAILTGLSQSHLNLRYRHLGPHGARALAQALSQNVHIDQLDLTENGLNSEGAVYVCEMLLENDLIQTVDLSYNDLKKTGAMAISEVILNNKGLKEVALSGNGFVDSDSEMLAIALRTNENIRELNLSYNDFSILGGRAFGLALATNYTLKVLDLSWNHLRRKGAVALFKGLEDNCALTHLHLSYNGLGYEGCLALGKMLKVNRVMKYLDISNNRVTWDAAFLLSKGLKVNETLNVLKAGNNPLTTTGCMDIIEAVAAQNCAVSELDLENVLVIGEFDMMATAISQNRPFQFKHGGIVGSHDVLGERHGKKMTPMQRVIEYMKKTGLRPTELFRNMDKQVSQNITHTEMVVRLSKAGINMPSHEVKELLAHMARTAGESEGGVNYKNMARSVQDQVVKDRIQRIRQRERKQRLKTYHKEILTHGAFPPINGAVGAGTYSDANSRSFSRLSMDSIEGGHRPESGGSGHPGSYSGSGSNSGGKTDFILDYFKLRRHNLAPSLQNATTVTGNSSPLTGGQGQGHLLGRMTSQNTTTTTGSPKVMFSMSKPLGSKPGQFGAPVKKKKKKKKKGKK